MTRLAGEQLGLGDRVETLDMELHRQGKSYTSDTLAELKARYPEDELWLLMGTDMFLSFHTWHEPEKIASLAGIAAFGRTEEDIGTPVFRPAGQSVPDLYPNARIFTLTVPGVIDISSTELREELAAGKGGKLLPPAVYGYILRNHLYGTDVNLKAPATVPAAAGGPQLSEAQAHPPCAGHGAGGHPSGGALRRGCGEGPRGGAAPRLHEEAGDGRSSWHSAGSTALNWTSWSRRR